MINLIKFSPVFLLGVLVFNGTDILISASVGLIYAAVLCVILEKVKLGKKKRTSLDVVKKATADAQARNFIERMEKQYDTVIGERGVGLSGGQKQRISIARALAKKTPVLVMDDSTSALDMETEQCIQSTLRELNDTTKIIIGHRISAVCNADEIIILENGAIAERGTHKSLLAQKGLYYKTYLAQYGEYEKEV